MKVSLVFLLGFGLSLFHLTISAVARADATDLLSGWRWSPDNEWVALNWPERPELFVISAKSGVSFTLRPSGDIPLDGGQVFATQGSPGGVDLRHTTRTVASPGRGPLALLEWSPDSTQFAYRTSAQSNAIFSVVNNSVTRQLAAWEPLPWRKTGELHVAFELLLNAKSNRPTSYLLGVQTLNGVFVKQVLFENPREIHLIPVVREGEASLISGDGQFVLYPRAVGGSDWELVRESVIDSNAAPQPVTKPGPAEPYQWQLSHDDKFLALLEGNTLRIGALDDWAHARAVALPHDSVLARWSPDDRFVALLDGQSLSVMNRDSGDPTLVTESCPSRFWGWRGRRLYFGDARGDLTDLSYVDAGHVTPPVRVSTWKHEWSSATRDVDLSPDATRLVCIVPEIDYMARTVWQLWERDVRTNGEWQLMYEMKAK